MEKSNHYRCGCAEEDVCCKVIFCLPPKLNEGGVRAVVPCRGIVASHYFQPQTLVHHYSWRKLPLSYRLIPKGFIQAEKQGFLLQTVAAKSFKLLSDYG